ncbi:MAG: DUF1223 domain-containing protein [Bacteroidota bacterium]
MLPLRMLIALIIAVFSLGISSCSTDAHAAVKGDTLTTGPHPVLVELFTSQGCSSCPPADEVLAKLHAEARVGQSPVIALSYHVDYWNRLGWTDPYSQTAFSERQRAYAQHLDGRVYTPQAVVQGRSGHVGSRERELRRAIQTASTKASSVQFTTRLTATTGNLQLHYQVKHLPEQATVYLALVEEEVQNSVTRGENRGRQLVHTQVVRDFITLPIRTEPAEQFIELSLAGFAVPQAARAILFAQDERTWEILGVAAFELTVH